MSFSVSGTLPSAISMANPSAMAVLPTPGSPINTGLFFVLLLKICIILSISFFRPITGSILSCLAHSVRFLPYLSSNFDEVEFSEVATDLFDFLGYME